MRPMLNGMGSRAPASFVSSCVERTAMAASNTVITPIARLSSSPGWGIAELVAAQLPSSFISLLWAHSIFIILQSMSPVHTKQLKPISLEAGLMWAYMEVTYGKAAFFLLPWYIFCYYY